MPKLPDPKQLLNLQAQHERADAAPTGEVVLALDYGEKCCGLAMALDGITVLPVGVVNTSELTATLQRVIKQHQIQILVVGLPVSSDGSENKICAEIRRLATKWSSAFSRVSLELVNERFSSQAALSPNKDRIDDLAAMQILQFYLDQTSR